MRYGSGIGQNGATASTEPETRVQAAVASAKEIPYDYVATFRLEGKAGRRVQDVITVSTEGSFIAGAIGYSFIPKALEPPVVARGTAAVTIDSVPLSGGTLLADLLVALPASAFTAPAGTTPAAVLLVRSYLQSETERVCGIHFKYSIVESGTGRELQNQAIHNIAGLGSADGQRPFRPFARPALFAPRSTIRFEVEEISEGPLYADGQLFIVLHGYKRLGE